MRRLAVLTTFEGDWPFTQRHPDDGQKVAAALQPLRPDWVFDTWPVSKGRWPDDVLAYDGIVITGSPASVNDDSDWIRLFLVGTPAGPRARRARQGSRFGGALTSRQRCEGAQRRAHTTSRAHRNLAKSVTVE